MLSPKTIRLGAAFCVMLSVGCGTQPDTSDVQQDGSAQVVVKDSSQRGAIGEQPDPDYRREQMAKEVRDRLIFSMQGSFGAFTQHMAHQGLTSRLAPGARVTENGLEGAALGMGQGADRRVFPTNSVLVDPETLTAFMASMDGERPTPFWARFKFSPEQIGGAFVEVEIVTGAPADAPLLKVPAPRKVDASPTAEKKRLTRAELVAIADAYFDGVERANGQGIAFHESCERIENGVQVTNNPALSPLAARDCAQSMANLGHIQKVRERRYPVAFAPDGDGYVVALAVADVPGGAHPDVLSNPTVVREVAPASVLIAQTLTITGGRITRVEAMSRSASPGASSGWTSAQ